jgi:tetratricopeptide (TPR) repeat protein
MSYLNKPVTVFLSYCHKNKAIAEKIDKDLSRIGISIIRDEHSLKYTDSLNEFMQGIRKADFALLLISDEYLKSQNCLYEVGQLLKEINVWEKILPVIVGKTDIYSTSERLNYLRYWQNQESKLKAAIADIDAINILSSLSDLKKINSYCGFIDEFLSRIVDMFHIDYQSLVEKNYQPLFDKLGVTDYTYLTELLEIAKIKDIGLKDIALEEYQDKFGANSYFYSIKAKIENDFGRTDKAKYFYNKSLDLDPTNTDALNNLGFLYHYTYGDFCKAGELYERALRINPSLITTLLNLGVLYNQVDMKDSAIELFEQVLRLDTSNYKAYQNLGNIYSIPGMLDIEKAEINLKQAFKYNPTHFETLLTYGNFLKVYKKDIEGGNKLYRKAKKYDKSGKYRALLNTLLKHSKA